LRQIEAENHIISKNFRGFMRLIYAIFILLMALMTSAECQQTAENWHNKGVDLYTQGIYDEAINAYDEAIRLKPNDTAAWINKGNALCMQFPLQTPPKKSSLIMGSEPFP